MSHIQISKKTLIVYRAFSDYECHEFHLTPVLTFTWHESDVMLKGYALALEWGMWAVYIGIAKAK